MELTVIIDRKTYPAGITARIREAAAFALALAASVIPFEKAAGGRTAAAVRAERYMDTYGNQILRLAYTYVHNMADAEDILQETLIRVLEAAPDFENEAHERAYIFRTAANLSKNRIISNKRRETDELREDLLAEDREDLSFVWEAVRNLPKAQREVIHLFYQEGMGSAEIAGILGRNESTVRSDLRRARQALKQVLKEEYDFGEI